MFSSYDTFLRFVLDACKRLKERKSYLMYTAVGCLGVAALSDLVKEVNHLSSFYVQISWNTVVQRFFCFNPDEITAILILIIWILFLL